jgi:hypothetical protein
LVPHLNRYDDLAWVGYLSKAGCNVDAIASNAEILNQDIGDVNSNSNSQRFRSGNSAEFGESLDQLECAINCLPAVRKFRNESVLQNPGKAPSAIDWNRL